MSRLRQVVICTRDLETVENDVSKALESFVTYRDPEIQMFGLRNALLPIGLSFVEVVSPLPGKKDDETAAGRFLNKYGEGGYMILVQLRGKDEMFYALDTAKNMGLKRIHEGSRTRDLESKPFDVQGPGFEKNGIAGFHLHPKDVGVIAELTISKPRNEWIWAGNDWRKADQRTKIAHSSSLGFAGVVLACHDPELTSNVWIDLLCLDRDSQRRVEEEDQSIVLTLDDDSHLTFRKSQGPDDLGLVQVIIYTSSPKIRDGDKLQLGGLEFVFMHQFGDSHL